jgi:O-antigen/teichoic acid export membrane protein
MPYLIPLLVKKEIYYQSFAFLAILSIGFATRGGYYLFLAPLYFFKKTKALPRVLFLSALFQIAACTILIRYYGLMGAVWANFLVKPVEVFLLYLESRKVFRFRFNRWKILYSPLIFILYVVATEFLKTDGNRLYIGLSQMALSFVLVWFTYRKELIPMIRDRLGR